MKYKFEVAYVGTSFGGFQKQENTQTIQSELEKAFSIFFRQPIKIQGASRTDSGVHALGQVCSFSLDNEELISLSQLERGINAILPGPIKIRNTISVAKEFHPINSATSKVYRYLIKKNFIQNPFLEEYCWSVHPKLNFDIMLREAQEFVGLHDFSSFCNADSDAQTKIRELLEIKCFISNHDLIEIWFHGRGFLKQMVRIMVGTLVDVASLRLQPGVSEILLAKDRACAGKTAPPQGLALMKIAYHEGDIDSIDQLRDQMKEHFYI
jgi:tRNA pseudouridine38-40 synthase